MLTFHEDEVSQKILYFLPGKRRVTPWIRRTRNLSHNQPFRISPG